MGNDSAVGRAAGLLGPSDWPLVEELFADVFGHPLQRQLTDWKYGPGRGLSIGVRSDDGRSLTAHCGLMFRDVVDQGRIVRAAQFADLMVRRQQRGQLLRMGSPFAKVVGHAMSLLGSAANPGNPQRLTFGFPSARAMKLAEHLGLVREVDHVHELSWLPLPAAVPARVTEPSADLVGVVDRLWADMLRDLSGSLVGVRDSAWFLPRFLQHPARDYQVHLVRGGGGQPLALFALRQEGERMALIDWVGPLLALPTMLAGARAATAAAGLPVLCTWMTQGHVDRLAIDIIGRQLTEFRIICRGDLDAEAWSRQQGRWWLTPGDTDYR